MTLQQLKYVIKAVEYGSITEAAKQLYITQPSLSSAVKELENELGFEIFSRSTTGITLTVDGAEFLSYARQVVEQAELLEQRYMGKKPSRQLCSVSTQHYAFSVNAFVELVKESNAEEYEFILRETRTHDIIQDVSNMRSEIGILYLSRFNEKVISKLLKENRLEFHPLFEAVPHVFVSASNPLSAKKAVTLEDLEEFPCLSFEQGEFNSFYFSEEILSTIYHKKSIHVSDRATLFNLLIGLNGYTICTGVLSSDLNGDNIVSVPLVTASDEKMRVGWIVNSKAVLSSAAERYIEHLKKLILDYGFDVIP
ncbi:MAG: LysR family transcriptional regulator [Oscillospiraceae bacterium]|jgi:DNA-binding transcriptional LysR family regulator|nr:LysR family transcriptional regulator [Oscillospiraceae bacterium]